MIVIDQYDVRDIPVLEVVDHEKINQSLPVMIYFHGFTSSKEQDLPQAYLMAERGYRVLLPDSMHHGDRQKSQIQIKFKVISGKL
ncbi:hypothetical protein [Piscibacillus salipiscarius]|uniref:hypothetical protein n=1 Tax=Piscibacillus salipiscarius TaxID=299480 RepID=UPI0006D0095F|nr:hypothetical protein [Piscibacillus salipiscarius]